jgi:hypothetical protein
MLKENSGHRGRLLLTRPVALQFTRDRHPRDRNDAGHDHAADGHLVRFGTDVAGGISRGIHLVASPAAWIAGMARQISDQSAAMMIFLRPLFFTASTTRVSSQVLMKVRSIGFCSGNTS